MAKPRWIMNADILWGIAGFVIGALSGSFLSAAGRDLYDFVKRQLKQSHEVEPGYVSTLYPPQNCAWIPEENLKNKEKISGAITRTPLEAANAFVLLVTQNFRRRNILWLRPMPKSFNHITNRSNSCRFASPVAHCVRAV